MQELLPFDGVVLAGGQSLRMGQDKALLLRGDESMLSFTVRRLLEANASKVWVNRNAPLPEGLEAKVVTDLIADRGPLSGLHAAIERVNDTPLLFVPVDLPQLTAETLSELVRFGQQESATVFFKGHPLPLYIHNPKLVLPELARRLTEHAGLSVMGFLEAIGAVPIDYANEVALTNCNTLEDWKNCSFR